jgi:hypothetical protein
MRLFLTFSIVIVYISVTKLLKNVYYENIFKSGRSRRPTTSGTSTTTAASLPIHDDMIDVDLTDPDGDFETM